jgi:hypothetical protein
VSRDQLRRRYEELSQWPLVVLAVLFVAAYAWGVLRPDLPHPLLATLRVVTVVTWPVFLGDYVVRLGLADQRRRFVRENWVDGIAVCCRCCGRCGSSAWSGSPGCSTGGSPPRCTAGWPPTSR